MSSESTDIPTGHEVIRGYLNSLDGSPGVYRMLDTQARVLYVGKARNLKARVSNYARPTGHSGRIARMISETATMMFLTTRTETEALLLEQNLIKQLKPRYNVLLRDDKSFPNILVTGNHPYPMLKKHRGARKEKGSYYGPFASAGSVNRTLNQLQRVFLLRNCTDSVFDSRTRPCSIRSNGVLVLALARYAKAIMRKPSKMPSVFCLAARPIFRNDLRTKCSRPLPKWNSSALLLCATGSRL